jgi:hypothetical protein
VSGAGAQRDDVRHPPDRAGQVSRTSAQPVPFRASVRRLSAWAAELCAAIRWFLVGGSPRETEMAEPTARPHRPALLQMWLPRRARVPKSIVEAAPGTYISRHDRPVGIGRPRSPESVHQVTLHGSKVTSVRERVELRRYSHGASVDQTEARKATARSFGRSDRSAQRHPWLLRSIRPKRATLSMRGVIYVRSRASQLARMLNRRGPKPGGSAAGIAPASPFPFPVPVSVPHDPGETGMGG